MKHKDLSSFKKKVESTSPLLLLIVGQESKELARQFLPAHFTSFNANNFCSKRFSQEVETLPIFEKRNFVLVEEIDSLNASDLEMVLNYVINPHPKTTLILTTNSLSMSSKLAKEIEKKGELLNLSEEKPWEREKKLIDFAMATAQKEGCILNSQDAKTLVTHLQKDSIAVENEIKKIACYVGNEKKITSATLSSIFFGKESLTQWQLIDQILNFDFKGSIETVKNLLEEGTSIFALLAHLKQQTRNHFEILSLGFQEALKKYPYLKEKKMESLKKYGTTRLKEGYLAIFHTEIEAKNSNTSPQLLMELLLLKLCPYSSSPTS